MYGKIYFLFIPFFLIIDIGLSGSETYRYELIEKSENFVLVKLGKFEKTPLEKAGKYIVKENETLVDVAEKNRVSVEKLMKLNGLKSRREIKPGQTLIIRDVKESREE